MNRGFPPHLAGRVFNRPLAIDKDYGLHVLSLLRNRLNVGAVDGKRWAGGTELEDAGAEDIRLQRAYLKKGVTFPTADGVAYIPIEGMLLHRLHALDPLWNCATGYDGIAFKVREAARDAAVRGVVFDTSSPGGEVSGCFATARLIRDLARIKPVLAMVNEQATSAAYALAAAAGNVVAVPGAQIGSIGVWTMHVDMSKALADDGINVTLIHAGAHKVDGHPYAPLPAEVLARIQADVEATRTAFATQVATHRGLSVEAVLATEADTMSAEDALAAGLIDAVGDVHPIFDDFIAALAVEPAPAASAASKA